VLLVTAADLQNGRVLPAGRLRERATTAARADAWLAPASDVTVVAELAAAAGMQRVFAVKGAAGPLRWADPFGAPILTPPRRVVAVAAIAWPERFVGALDEAGFDVAATHTWGDHHAFTAEDGGVVREVMQRAGADLVVTTEKDAMRWLRRRPWSFPLAFLSWSLTAEPAGEFKEWLVERVARARAARP
jgi:tetraacyldisaccharide 4'-kinase